jgi:hypothetical protein
MVKGKAIDDRVVTGHRSVARGRKHTGTRKNEGEGLIIPHRPRAKASGGLRAKQVRRMNVLAGDRPRGVVGNARVGDQKTVGNVCGFEARRQAQGSRGMRLGNIS